jgi:CRP/FNR family transcriptional regulator
MGIRTRGGSARHRQAALQCKVVSPASGHWRAAKPRAILRQMSTRLRRISLPKGSRVFAPGEPCPGFVLLDSGTIRVSLAAENGREVVLYRVQPGDVCLQTFSCLINHTTYRAEGVAETDLSGTLLPPDSSTPAWPRTPISRRHLRFRRAALRRFRATGGGCRADRVRRAAGAGRSCGCAMARPGGCDARATRRTETASGRAFVSRGWRSSRGPGSSRPGAAGST